MNMGRKYPFTLALSILVSYKNIRPFRQNRLSLYNKRETLPKINFVLKNKMILTNTVFQQHTVNKWSDICFASASRPQGGSHVSSIITSGRCYESSSYEPSHEWRLGVSVGTIMMKI